MVNPKPLSAVCWWQMAPCQEEEEEEEEEEEAPSPKAKAKAKAKGRAKEKDGRSALLAQTGSRCFHLFKNWF